MFSKTTIITPDTPNPRAILIIFNKIIKHQQIQLSSTDICAAKFTTSNCEFFLLSIYLPSNTSISNHLKIISKFLDNNSLNATIISGDLNSSHTLWNSKKDTCRGNQILNMIQQYELQVFKTKNPSYNHNDGRNSFIDLTLANTPAFPLIKNYEQLNNIFSDHTPQLYTLNTEKPILSKQSSTWLFCEKHADWISFQNNFNNDEINHLNSRINEIKNPTDIDLCTQIFANIITSASYKSFATLKVSPEPRKYNVYHNSNIRPLYSATKRIKNKLNKAKHPLLKEMYRNKYIHLKDKLQNLVKHQTKQDWCDFINDNGQSTETPWGNAFKFIKNKLKDKMFNAPILNNQLSSNNLKSIIEQMFPSNESLAIQPQTIQPIPIVLPKHKTFSLIHQSNSRKAPGPDNITNNMLKNLPSSMSRLLHQIFEKCCTYGYFPNLWKVSQTCIIPKPNKLDYLVANSYRPVSLTSHISKIFEKIINNILLFHLDSNNLLNPNQFGFRAGKSTKDALLKIINDIEQQKNKFKAIIVVDFKGAFDNASHRLIMNSLDNLNCPTYICSIISHYLNNRKIIVKTNHTMCNHHPSGRGCPQGGVLSPLLWNIALDNLLNILSESNINTTAYADDLTLVISATDRLKLIDLINNTVQIIFDWAQNNNIPVNKDKTNVMFISKRKTIPPTTTIINSVESTKILGIIFSHNLRFDEHVHKKISDAYKYMNILKNYVSAKFGLSSKKRITLYNCFVKPSLLYAAELWFNKINNRSKRMLTTLDNAMLRNTINAYRSTPINCINILTNTIPIIEIIKCKQKINNLYPKKHHRSIINYLNNRIIPTKNKPKNTRIIIDINYKHEKQFIYCVANFTSNNDTTTNCLHTKYYSHTGIEEAIINTTKKSIKKLTVLNNLQPNTSIFLRCPKKTYLTTSETFVSTNTIKLYQLLNQYSLTLCINYKSTSEFPNIFSDNIKTSHNFYDKKSFSILIKNESNQILSVIKQNCTKPLVIILNENKNFQLLSINQAITSLTTGHGPTRDHLFKKFNIGSTSRCSSCEADQNYNHLLSCPIFTDILDSYNTVNIDNIENLMVNLLRENKFEQFAMDIHKKLINLNSSII